MKVAGPIRATLKRIDAGQPAFHITPLEDLLSGSYRKRTTHFFLTGCLALLALLLAFIGIYGVVSYGVNLRVHEIGVRMALGARRSVILWIILQEALQMCLIGLPIGIGAALAAKHLIASLLFGVSATDAFIFIGTALFVIVTTLIAGCIPAYRASTINPSRSLRYE
jgi:ABC-type antimicrobial peptide transport system permease subunit